jgi:hypothetical protein
MIPSTITAPDGKTFDVVAANPVTAPAVLKLEQTAGQVVVVPISFADAGPFTVVFADSLQYGKRQAFISKDPSYLTPNPWPPALGTFPALEYCSGDYATSYMANLHGMVDAAAPSGIAVAGRVHAIYAHFQPNEQWYAIVRVMPQGKHPDPNLKYPLFVQVSRN